MNINLSQRSTTKFLILMNYTENFTKKYPKEKWQKKQPFANHLISELKRLFERHTKSMKISYRRKATLRENRWPYQSLRGGTMSSTLGNSKCLQNL